MSPPANSDIAQPAKSEPTGLREAGEHGKAGTRFREVRLLLDHCYIFPHVPKCAGTSMLKTLLQSGLSVLVDYDGWMYPDAALIDVERRAQDLSRYDVIYGHFPIGRYERAEHRYVALVRDPLDRCLSNYHFVGEHWRSFVNDYPEYSEIGRRISTGDLPFLDYLKTAPDILRVYRHFLGYWPRERFDLIGTTDNIDSFLTQLSRRLAVPLLNDHQERQSTTHTLLSEAEAAEARTLLAAEYAWFRDFISPGNPK